MLLCVEWAYIAPKTCSFKEVVLELPRKLSPRREIVLAQIVIFRLASQEHHLVVAQSIYNMDMPCIQGKCGV
ncbi:hypothetical protein Pint_01604 [Pistacia integerrima]|uniref:Uncharacterized protein n=1 Tax=Pistacia integerrima TaxID=434235 RepID=A0ACC0ZMU1_9ROSI|nr:hypothetical protein Pint_01604 [Pistacia integerrima]